MNLFETALRAKLPIIKVHTRDLLNARDVIDSIVLKTNPLYEVKHYVEFSALPNNGPQKHIYTAREIPDPAKLHEELEDREEVLVALNVDCDPDSIMFDAGELPVPYELKKDVIRHYLNGHDQSRVYQELKESSLREIEDILRLASSHRDLTLASIQEVKRELVPTTMGLEEVPYHTGIVVARKEMTKYLRKFRSAFLDPDSGKLSPRGVLLRGHPGTGKTHMAKVLAMELEVPLFRASISALMVKWHGQSERNLINLLANVEQEAPCVLLLDEVEKELATTSADIDSGVSARLLSCLLWWLAEHTSKVITVMTTNNAEALPPELYRPGRLDAEIEVDLFSKEESLDFVNRAQRFYGLPTPAPILLRINQGARYTAAELEASVLDYIRENRY